MRTILHCDMNNFFASVESIDKPELKAVPMAVCGRVEDRKGIVLAKNELAKACGVSTGDAIWQAKAKCKNLVTVEPHFPQYMEYSKKAFEIYSRFTDQIEPFGIDECWLDVTGSLRLFGSGVEIADKLRGIMKSELGLTISVGVSFNKVFAKLGSDLKKPDAVTEITADNFKEKIWDLPAEYMLNVGRATLKKLHQYHIVTIGDIADRDEAFLVRLLGVNGSFLKSAAMGLNDTPVNPNAANRVSKSIGNSTTCVKDLSSSDEVWRIMLMLSQTVCGRLRREELCAYGVQISVKNSSFETKMFQKRMITPIRSSQKLAKEGFALFLEHYDWAKNVRAIGICAIQLEKWEGFRQENFFDSTDELETLEKVDEAVDSLENRFGKGVVSPLSIKIPLNIPDQSNKPSFFH
ncbi:MAG: DNA polymerase IV [Oscillospiraceae bacterium]